MMITRENMAERLRNLGLSVTMPRLLIMEYLECHHTHPTVDRIHKDLSLTYSGISKTTVYNTVKVLSRCGAISMLSISDNQVNLDGDTSPHAHLICRECGEIYDIPLPEAMAMNGEGTLDKDGNMIEEIHLYYHGVCRKCRNGHCGPAGGKEI